MCHLGWFLYVKKFAIDLSQVTDKLYHIKIHYVINLSVTEILTSQIFIQFMNEAIKI